jgi:hypothetical protein
MKTQNQIYVKGSENISRLFLEDEGVEYKDDLASDMEEDEQSGVFLRKSNRKKPSSKVRKFKDNLQ